MRQRGQWPYSAQLTCAATFLGAIVGAYFCASELYHNFNVSYDRALRVVQGEETASVSSIVWQTLTESAWELWPIGLAMVVTALGIGLIQTKGAIVPSLVLPDVRRLSVSRNMQNLFSVYTCMETVKLVMAFMIIAVFAGMTFYADADELMRLARSDVHGLPYGILSVVGNFLVRIALLIGILAVLDLGYRHWRFLREHRMTRREVYQEQKEEEGDPQQKHIRKSRWREDFEDVNMDEACVLVSDSMSTAVALKYSEGSVPQILAVARREMSAQHLEAMAIAMHIPVIQDAEISHQLSRRMVGQYVPQELFDVVARILHRASPLTT